MVTFIGFIMYQTSFGKKAMPWHRWLVTGHLLHRSVFDPRPIYRRFVVDKVAL
jgi:hypothetical protein